MENFITKQSIVKKDAKKTIFLRIRFPIHSFAHSPSVITKAHFAHDFVVDDEDQDDDNET